MENFYIQEYFDWRVRRFSHLDRAVTRVLKATGSRLRSRTADMVDGVLDRLSGRSFSPTRSGVSTSVEQRINMYHLLSQTIAYGVPGHVVELGCNEGQSAVLMRKVLDGFGSSKEIHLYDSFEGLPSTSAVDGLVYREGDLSTSEDVVRRNFSRYSLQQPAIHRGWFDRTLPSQLPDQIAFAHLDGDLYHSILTSLRYVYPRLSPGAVCLIDDYCDPAVHPSGWNHLPGVKQACDEFFVDKPERVAHIYSGAFSHGFFRKDSGTWTGATGRPGHRLPA